MHATDVVVTGVGVVSPIGIGRREFWSALCNRRSGVERLELPGVDWLPLQLGAEVRNFDPKLYVANRKSLKVMSRDAQLGMAAAALACTDAGIGPGTIDPDRFGVVLGADRICGSLSDSEVSYGRCFVDGKFDYGRWGTEAMAASFPLGFLRVLPNMIASHISIAHDARGPNNTIHQAEVSGLLAVNEAAGVVRRGTADVMLAGGASSQMSLFDCIRRCVMGILSPRQDEPTAVVRPFDAGRDGQVWGEGAAIFVLESRRHAEVRGARVLAQVLGWSATCEPAAGNGGCTGLAIRRAIGTAIQRAGIREQDLSHLNAHGLSTPRDDRTEAQAIRSVLPDVPVTAVKSYFGNLGAAGSAVEMAASLLSLGEGLVPQTLNFQHEDPDCPIRLVCGEPMSTSARAAVSVNWMPAGQSAAVVLGAA